jgi:hypothetical protein
VTAVCDNADSLQNISYAKEIITMKNSIQKISLSLGKIDARHIRLILALVTLILFILGAGAPSAPGGFSG